MHILQNRKKKNELRPIDSAIRNADNEYMAIWQCICQKTEQNPKEPYYEHMPTNARSRKHRDRTTRLCSAASLANKRVEQPTRAELPRRNLVLESTHASPHGGGVVGGLALFSGRRPAVDFRPVNGDSDTHECDVQ